MSKKTMMNKSIFIIIFILITKFSLVQPAFAQESSTSTQVVQATDSSKTTQKLKERIERIVEEKRDQIKGIISNMDAKKQGFIGQVQRVSAEAITVRTSKSTRIIPLNQDATLMRGGKEIEISDIAVDEWAVVMGVLENDTFKAIRVLISTDTLRPDPHLISLGSIKEISRSSMTLIPRGSASSTSGSGEENSNELKISFNNSTIFEDISGEELLRTEIVNVEEQTQALVISLDDDGDLIAKRVRILTKLEE